MIRVERSAELKPHRGRFKWCCSVGGKTLDGVSHQPLLDACREIKRISDLPADTQIGLYREGRENPDLICKLGWGAEHTVEENAKRGPRFVKWRAYPEIER